MKKYIVITTGGCTYDEEFNECDNCQVLWVGCADSKESAIDAAILEQNNYGNSFDHANCAVYELELAQ